ncbi:RHS repeat-associated core domain-containing protein [Flavobacterium sp. FlaQc-47]|uniref:RHS repeat-associated core domain-containing protein n=1 Tax=Flavobacterium sp. FlaQc-47 TaxID=3374180 RepID=UPI00375811F2
MFFKIYNYKYQGQERQDELSLNWDSFKWRNYDYAIGRFMCIDPLAEKYTYNSPYAFAENRVVDGRELEGLEWVDSHKNKNLIYDPSANNGKGDFTKYATQDDRNMAKSLNMTETGRTQFNKFVNSDIPTTVTLDKENLFKDGNGNFIVGETTPSENGYVKVTEGMNQVKFLM